MTEQLFSSDGDDVEKALGVLREMPKYPFQDAVDRPMVRRLIDENPTVDVPWELRKWSLWMTEHRSSKKVRYRARIETWVRRARSYQRGNAIGEGVSGQAATATVHGATSDGLEQW